MIILFSARFMTWFYNSKRVLITLLQPSLKEKRIEPVEGVF